MKAKLSFFRGLAPSLAVSATFASVALFTAPSAIAQEFELIVPDATRESCATLGGYMKKGECRVRTTIADNTNELIRVEAESVDRDDYLASEIGRVEGQSIATDNDQNAEIGRVEAQSLATDEAQNARMDAADESAAGWRKTVNDHSLNIMHLENTKLTKSGGVLTGEVQTSTANILGDFSVVNKAYVDDIVSASSSGLVFKGTFSSSEPLHSPAGKVDGELYICTGATFTFSEAYLPGDLAVVKDEAYIKIERPELHELEAMIQMNTSVNAEQNARMDAADASAAQWRHTVNDHSLNILINSNRISALEAETAYVYDDLAPRLYVKSNGERLGELVPFPFSYLEYSAVTGQGYVFTALVMRDPEAEPLGAITMGQGPTGGSSFGYDNPSCAGQPLLIPRSSPLIEDTVGLVFSWEEELFYVNYDDGDVITDFYFVDSSSGECESMGDSDSFFVMPAYPNEPMVTGIPFFTSDIPQPSIGW